MKKFLPVLFTVLPLTTFAAPDSELEEIKLTASEIAEESSEPDTSSDPTKGSEEVDPAEKALKKDYQALQLENSLEAEKFKQATSGLRAEVARLKLEKEALAEKLALEELKRTVAVKDDLLDFKLEKEDLERKAELAEKKAQLLTHQVKSVQAEAALATLELKSQIEQYEVQRRRDSYADSKPQYLDNPMKEDGTLVVSDRRIPFNGPVTTALADRVTERINYFNNKNPKQPIFIVIDSSPGGSVMAGYRILKSMEGSEAPVYVVVKSFAASMAACITTLAEKSYAYPNAVILHHQISSTLWGGLNLTQQKELYEESQRWWERLANPIAEKMGITTEEMIKRMYEESSSGDWTVFGDEAQELKWVDHVVNRIHETSLLQDPDMKRSSESSESALVETLDKDGRAVTYLPRLSPKDVYFLYNPDQYYQLR